MDGGEEEVVGVHQGHKLQSVRHGGLHLLTNLVDALVHLRSIRARRLEDQHEGTRLATDVRDETIALGTDLNIGHLFQMQHVTTVGGLDHDVLKLLNLLQRTLILHGVLVLVIRLLTEVT